MMKENKLEEEGNGNAQYMNPRMKNNKIHLSNNTSTENEEKIRRKSHTKVL